MKRTILFILMFSLCAMFAIAQDRVTHEPNEPDGDLSGPHPAPPKKDVKWNLVFEENFDGDKVNLNEWSIYDSRGHDGNGLRTPRAFSVEDGNLVITAQMVNGVIESGGMAHKRNYLYGKFEFRVKCDADPSGATSGVVLTWPQSEKWPIDGENDIFETLTNKTRRPLHTFIHYGANNSQYHKSYDVDATQWQVMAMEWFPDVMYIYLNGELVWTLTDTEAIPHVPHHICPQLDAFAQVMGDPVRMYVDWIKIYQVEK